MATSRLRLAPGLRVSERTGTALQVGLDHGRRAVLPDSPATRALLDRLAHGLDPARVPGDQHAAYARLAGAGLLVAHDDAGHRARARAAAVVGLDAPVAETAALARLLTEAGLALARDTEPTCSLVVRQGCEPRRADLDPLVRRDRPHLLVTLVAGRIRVGPCVVPGVTACLRCVDEHLTDADPRHPLLVEQHLERDPGDRASPAALQLALAWAVRDLVALVEGDRPTSWSSTVDLAGAAPEVRAWRRHPRCGCAWADLP